MTVSKSEDNNRTTVLIVDDEPNVLYALQKGLQNEPYDVVTAANATEAVKNFERQTPDLVLSDIRLPDKSGLELFNELHELDARIPIILMTAHGTAETAIEAMKQGAFDYLLKPYDLTDLRATLTRAIDASRLNCTPVVMHDDETEEADEDYRVDRLIGSSPAMQAIYKEIGRVAPQDVNVLILGESGTGKELVARAIYRHSQRSKAPFVALNCAALPDSVLESELFGHEKGAFTGADRRRIGRFEQASGGTLFLDELGDMALTTQAKLLRVLQEGTLERLGSNDTIHTDVRILAATNRNLPAMIEAKEFREDLFYRLNTFTITIPPLRDRLEDLPQLVDYFVRTYDRKRQTPRTTVSQELLSQLSQQAWPGNVRELQAAIKYAMVKSSSGSLLPGTLLPTVNSDGNISADPVQDAALRVARRAIEEYPQRSREWAHSQIDQHLVRLALERCGGNQSHAATLLGISRTTLRTLQTND